MLGRIETQLLDHLRGRTDEMTECLIELAEIESPSHCADSQKPVLDWFTARLDKLGFRCRRIPGRQSGGMLFAVDPSYPKSTPRQLIMGHSDTVWPKGTLDKMPVHLQAGCLRGPGTYDMKGGLVQAVFAIEALRALNLRPSVGPIWLINSDEEIGSHESETQIHRLAKLVERVWVMEPSLGSSGALKTRRKGVGRFRIEVTGRAAHAGLDPDRGISAIEEMAHVVVTLRNLNDPSSGVTLNVGTISGGTTTNVIAAKCVAELDVRVPTQADAERVEQSLRSIQPTLSDATIQVEGGFNRPPLESTTRNRRLWQWALELAREMQFELSEGAAGGGSDGNWTSLHAATLDGLGAVGGGAHAVTEHVLVNEMPKRAALLAGLLMRPTLESQNHR